MTSAAAVFKKRGVQRAERLRPSGRCGPTPTTLKLNLNLNLNLKASGARSAPQHFPYRFLKAIHPLADVCELNDQRWRKPDDVRTGNQNHQAKFGGGFVEITGAVLVGLGQLGTHQQPLTAE